MTGNNNWLSVGDRDFCKLASDARTADKRQQIAEPQRKVAIDASARGAGEIVALCQVVVTGGDKVWRTKCGRRHEREQRDGREVE